MEYAGAWKRFVAIFVDGILFVTASFVLGIVLGLASSEAAAAGTAAAPCDCTGAGSNAFTAVFIGLVLTYYVVCEACFGATLGKRLVGLRVVRADGSELSWKRSLVRNLLRPVDALFLYLVALISMAFSPTEQRLGDRVAGTVVVRR